MPLLYHFSEDPSIGRFEPHVAPGSAERGPLVWAIDDEHRQLYWFPRDCPRVSFWIGPRSSPEARAWYEAQTAAPRVHAIESAWFERVRAARLYVYRMPDDTFEQADLNAGHWVSRTPVEPLEVRPVGDLLELHASSPDEFRVVPSLWPLHGTLRDSTLAFSMTRMRNASKDALGADR